MPSLPTGTVTFLFTDIEGSTRLLHHLGNRYIDVLAEYRRLLHAATQAAGGQEAGTPGDACVIVFPRATDAVMAAVAAQRAIHGFPWPEGTAVRVRMGLHTGEPLTAGDEYVGMDVHRAARICAAGHGGQIVLSDATHALVVEHLPQDVTLRSLGKHRLKDLTSLQLLFDIVAPGLPAEFPPLRTLDSLPNNLPRQLTSFIGREREIAEVRRLLATARAVTLTGSGGCGKTRLALQVAADLVEEFTDGVWLVELAALSDPSLVLQSAATVLSVSEQPARSLAETLVDVLRSKSLLLVLDNCEHLVDACARFTEMMLRACPGLRILATSREALNIAGEATFRVPSLSLPERERALSLEHLVQYEAVRLFADRAGLARPGFAIAQRNASPVVQLCRRLDGIPLAIELAAARMKVLSVEQIAARLDDRFHLLTGGARTALPHHQTLRTAMDWSYDLLEEGERALLRRLSVFAGGWTLEAAEVVCAGDGVQRPEVLDLLARIADKSLIIVEEREDGTRYRQLETVRQYFRERLLASGEAPVVRGRHRDWFLDLAERAQPEFRGAEQAAWFNRLEAEHDNLRTALEYSMERGEVEAALRLASAVARFWFVRGYSAEGRGWLEAALNRSSGAPAAVRASALNAAGNLAVLGQSDYTAGRSFFEKSLAMWRALGDRQGIARALTNLGLVASDQGEQAAARSLYEESLAILRELGDKWGIALSLNNLGLAAQRQGDPGAQPLLEQSLAMMQELGDRQHMAVALDNLGLVASGGGNYASAGTHFKESLSIRRDLGDKRGIAYSLEGIGGLALAQGLAQRATQLMGAAEALREVIRAPLPPVDCAEYKKHTSAARSLLGEEAFGRAWAEGRAMTPEQAISEALKTVGADPGQGTTGKAANPPDAHWEGYRPSKRTPDSFNR